MTKSMTMITWIICFSLLSFSQSSIAALDFDASFSDITLKKRMLLGKTYKVVVKVRNTGEATWSRERGPRLSITRNSRKDWRLSPISLRQNDRVLPGEIKKFQFEISAPSKTGIFGLQFQLQHSGKTIGTNSKTQMIIVETRSNRVKFISQLLPDKMNTGKEYSIVVQFKNRGSSTWSRKNGYKLGFKGRRNPWNVKNIKMDRSQIVPPGEVVTFSFKLKAPAKALLAPVQWQMKRGNKWFGEPSPKQSVNIIEAESNSGAEFVYQDMPGLQKMGSLFTVLKRGEIYPVTVTFKNTSDQNWTAGIVSLSAQNPPNSLTWSVDRVELKQNDLIPPGGIRSFSFKIIAPLQPGIYNFQWQMLQGFKNWFGEKSENISVTVK